MKTLVLAEKPSVGRDIGRVLHCQKKSNSYMEGSNYIVTWALGHLVTLKDPEGYDAAYKEWRLEDLPILPVHLKTEVIPKTGKQYAKIKELLGRKDVGDVVIATDAGREGELVARWILEKAGNKKRCRRLWISSVTDKAIKEGFAHLKDASEYDNLYRAAVSRAEADWLVGINATRALTVKYNAQLSCGRVQTPTLFMIAKREEEIRQFRPKPYYGIQIVAEGTVFTWKEEKSGSTSTFEKQRAEEIINKIKGEKLKVTRVLKKEKKKMAPLLYDLTELQRDANRRFGFSAKKTLDLMQQLYENHKILTYPRTDSRYLTEDILPTIPERLTACMTGPYRSLAAKVKNKKPAKNAFFVNNAKVGDHHAIIPTEQPVELRNLSTDERKIYDLVVRRFLAVLYPPHRYEETTVYAVMGKETFMAKGNRTIEEGYLETGEALLEDDEEMESEETFEASAKKANRELPKYVEGQTISQIKASIKEGKTKPPAHFNEATLLSAMENPVKYMENRDKAMVKTIGETGGLGTVATRADIIEKLFHTFLIEKKGNDIYVTSKARQLLELVPADLKKPELTADWEMQLSKIAEGRQKRGAFMSEIRSYTVSLLKEIEGNTKTFRHENRTNKLCPECGKHLLSVNGKNAKLLVCEDRTCGYRETVSRTSNARCPVCHKKMELSGNGEKAVFFCGCGYKERLEKFQERRKKEGGGVTKRDVASYMKKQQKEVREAKNNPFADALKGMEW